MANSLALSPARRFAFIAGTLAIWAIIPLVIAGVLLGRAQADPPVVVPDGKVAVCKWVSIPGEAERLQTGQNPIVVDQNAIPLPPPIHIGDQFVDAQIRSVVVGLPGDRVTIADCIATPPSTTTTSSTTSTTTTPTETTSTTTTTPPTSTTTTTSPTSTETTTTSGTTTSSTTSSTTTATTSGTSSSSSTSVPTTSGTECPTCTSTSAPPVAETVPSQLPPSSPVLAFTGFTGFTLALLAIALVVAGVVLWLFKPRGKHS